MAASLARALPTRVIGASSRGVLTTSRAARPASYPKSLTSHRISCLKAAKYLQASGFRTHARNLAQNEDRHTRHESTHTTSPSPATPSPHPPPPRRRSKGPVYIALALLTSSVIYYLTASDAPSTTEIFHDEQFTPFDLVAREDESLTSFILTLRPSRARFSSSLTPEQIAAQLRAPWEKFDLWAVEVKQPQLQIAREYTPLPPRSGLPHHGQDQSRSQSQEQGEVNDDSTTMRLLVRAVDGGEVSNYLGKLPVGSTVEIRGPKGGFDLTNRLGCTPAPAPASSNSISGPAAAATVASATGDSPHAAQPRRRDVVFLAGGTGIATALQAAESLLAKNTANDDDENNNHNQIPAEPRRDATRMTILWAVRSRSEIQALSSPHPGSGGGITSWLARLWPSSSHDENTPTELSEVAMPTNPRAITRQMQDLRAVHGDNFNVLFRVDEERRFISEKDVLRAVQQQEDVSHKGSRVTTRAETSAPPPPCAFHSQALQTAMPDGAPNAGRKDTFNREEDCACTEGDAGHPVGRNLLLISGPDGFISVFAGTKPWHGGGQIQGVVGGMFGRLQAKNPGLLQDWIVLKLG